ncbi:hypothetical protein DI09_183p20 [Mitosporidium daphniae]|uniref:Uncharacterized protein n=1 Tax=Mitosporidium daphniae TaxID=1485682 RepID=A0A098VU65_9MICR|nr:uncharacterized protein DI09_183p20 [Mitosporidium daphniae]KGG52354.1 hypothetical protein DI09_183p20 [Mitosporidium daphniae]|eukprot:XP_013238790.1 uncharacterized protein DI09_183p20 [Mitosporidium daphniae]
MTSRDFDILRQRYKFIPEDSQRPNKDWQDRMVLGYNDSLFREFALFTTRDPADSCAGPSSIAIRWRTKVEVKSGKGVYICSNLSCSACEELCCFEVPFSYVEEGRLCKTLVKLSTLKFSRTKIKHMKFGFLRPGDRVTDAKPSDREARFNDRLELP